MILVAQRVSQAQVVVDERTISKIASGLLVLVCAQASDSPDTTEFLLAEKLVKMRIFPDENNKMNISLLDLPNAELLLVPQFTLAADCRKGNRPSFTQAAGPEKGLILFNAFKAHCERLLQPHSQHQVQQGQFGAMMSVSLCNEGPTTIILQDRDFA